MMRYFRLVLLLLLLPTLLLPTGCEQEGVQRSAADGSKALFSADTVAFDTVFATLGTVTKSVKLYNPYDEPLLIESITLKGGRSSRFRLNVDGDTAMVVRHVEILPHDSIFIFVRANINPNSATEPFLIADEIVVEEMGSIALTAYGRNAVYHTPTPGKIYSVIDCEAWDHSRPHVIMGYAVIDSATHLELQAGDELYFGNDAVLWVYNEGTLTVKGTPERPVLFTSLRHDNSYRHLPGQWGYIWLSTGSIDNHISWAVIENGYVGLLVDTNVNSNPTLTIDHTVIRDMSLAGIIGQGSRIEGDHLLIHGCETAAMALQYGGNYHFRNSSIVGSWRYGVRKNSALVLNNWYQHGNTIYLRPLWKAAFENCLIYGDLDNEVLADRDERAPFGVSFDHCLLKADSTLMAEAGIGHTACLMNEDPKMIEPRNGNCHPADDSPAKGKGDIRWLSSVVDVEGKVRRLPPTIGALD